MKNRANKRLKVNFKIKTFLVFLVLSTLFWTLIKLSKTYTSDVKFEVSYYNLPIEKVVQNEPINEVTMSIVSSGFNLLTYKLNTHKLKFDLHNLAHTRKNKYYYLPNKHLLDLKSQLDIETSIVRVVQDSILLLLGKNKTKKVPVKLDADIAFKLGYNYADKIKITPKQITIVGPEDQLDTINEVVTSKLSLTDVSSEINQKVPLLMSEYDKINFSETEISVNIKVDKFTEGSLAVPFTITNLPKGYSITTFPTEVKVVYQVGLLNFSKITPKSVKVFCDFEDSKEHGLSYLIPKIKEKSSLITSVRIEPDKIEFLIEKR